MALDISSDCASCDFERRPESESRNLNVQLLVISSEARSAKSRNLHIQPRHTDHQPWLVAELQVPLVISSGARSAKSRNLHADKDRQAQSVQADLSIRFAQSR